MSDGSSRGLLDGLRVLDFTQALSGPFGTLILADLGADVVKVENPGRGDDARHWGPPFAGDDAIYFVAVNRNKRSVAVDLKTEDGRAVVRELLAGADVVVHNWRPGVARRLGLEYEDVKAIKPSIIYCAISGFGPDDPRTGYDQVVQGTSGAMSITGPEGAPSKWGIPAADLCAGMFAATAISAAARSALITGEGHRLDISLEDSLIAMFAHIGARQLASSVPEPTFHNGHATIAPYGLFRTGDGTVNICVGNHDQFLRMCAALGLDELPLDERFATNPSRVVHKIALTEALEARLTQLSTDEALAALELAGVPSGAVRTLDVALADPVVRGRGMIAQLERADFGTVEVPNSPWVIDGTKPPVYLAPPRLGEHDADVRAEWKADRAG